MVWLAIKEEDGWWFSQEGYFNWYPAESSLLVQNGECAAVMLSGGELCKCSGRYCDANGEWIQVSCSNQYHLICQAPQKKCIYFGF